MPPTATPVTATRAPVRVKAGSVVRIRAAIIRYDRRIVVIVVGLIVPALDANRWHGSFDVRLRLFVIIAA
jgi:hypothetical protein